MGAEKTMIARLKQELKHHPVVSILVFGFVLAGVEKMLEVKFACPCYTALGNAIFVSFLALIPAATSVGLMVLIHGWHGCNAKTLLNFVPALLWLALLLLDGQFVVCATSYWQGRFVSTRESFLKWCDPTSANAPLEYHLDHARWNHIVSQVTGIVVLFLLLLVFIKYVHSSSSGQSEDGDQSSEEEEPNNPETRHLQETTNI